MYLNAHTYYSLRYGVLSPEQLVRLVANTGVKELVLTDINNTSATYQFIQECKKYGIKPVTGIEFRRNNEFLYLGIAKNKEGWRELNSFLTKHSLEDIPLPYVAPEFDNSFIVYRRLSKELQALRDYEFIGIRPEEANRIYSTKAKRHLDKLVVFAPITFADKEGFAVHKLLRCIDLNIVLGNLKEKDHAKKTEIVTSPEKIKKAFAAYPVILENTRKLLDNCNIEMESTPLNNRRHFTGNKEDDYILLRKLAFNGCKNRYGENKIAITRTQKELEVIKQLDFESYFLITWDIVRYAKNSGYHHVGRGSGANSIVAYNLGITDVDPIELDLYFERFINPYRSSPPDFDLDFSWDERDDVTDYIFKRYGREYTALLATYNTFKGKSIIRELGKVFGLPKADIDTIVDEPFAKEKHHEFAKYIFHYGKMLEKMPNYLSIHAGGVIISEEPLNYFTSLKMMPKGFPITHFDMYGAEDLQFHKFDILSQRGLGHIKDAVKLIEQNKGISIDVHNVSEIKQDKNVKNQLASGECLGCFYIESPAMRGLLKKLHCDNYIQLVAASSIIRPGVAKSGMMKEYIKRFHNPDKIKYLHPTFKEHLSETFGVMVYQEDVLKIVHHFAGLDLAEADLLRRIMTGKRKDSDVFHNLRKKFYENCQKRGYSKQLTDTVWYQIASFSGYSFSKAHSASFAVESFQSLYLKTYYPLEFMVGVINNFGGFYHTETYVHEAKMAGGIIHPPCINNSNLLTNIRGRDIYLGFIHITSLERKLASEIARERQRNGLYESLEDFMDRVDAGKEQVELLIRIGAFGFTGKNKYELMWQKNALLQQNAIYAESMTLFEEYREEYELPVLEEGEYDQVFDEMELLGFPVSKSPFEILKQDFTNGILAKQFAEYTGKIVEIAGYFITRKYVRTVNKKIMNFGTFIDREGKFFDTVHFPQALTKYPFKGRGVYRIKGRVVVEFNFHSIEVIEMEKLTYVKDERY
ncbi:MAG TPA: DNA polymerase III subunit alpha [Bacteroidetes bacterium]|nr:DNA polymerase III subunit alpha [Bacteroidota bacterium]